MNIRRAILALLPLTLPLYVVRFHVGPFPTTMLEVIVVILLFCWLVHLSFLRRQESSLDRTTGQPDDQHVGIGWIPASAGMTKNTWFWPLLLWLFAGLIAVVVASDHVAALGLWRAYFLEPVLVFAMLLDLARTDKDRRALLRSLVIVTSIVAAWAILQWLGILSIPRPWDVPPNGIRATGPFPFPNALALFAAPVAALCFAMTTGTRKPRPYDGIWLWVGFGNALLATILAKSAGGIIAICAAIFIALVLQRKTRFIAIGGTIFAILFILAIPSIRKQVTEKIFFDAWSGKVRLVMWGETWNMLRDHPLFGVGLGAYPDAIKPYHKATWMEIFQYPHNILLNLWSETGLLGIFAFGWILWTWINKKGGFETRPCAIPVLISIIVHGFVDVPYFKNDLAILFWILIVLTDISF